MNWAVGGLRMSIFIQLLPKPFGLETLCVCYTYYQAPTQPTVTSPTQTTQLLKQLPPPSLWRAKPFIARAYIDWLLLPTTSTVEHLSHPQKCSSTKVHLKVDIYSLQLCGTRTSSQKLPPPFANSIDHGSSLYASCRRLLRLAAAICKHAWYELLRLLWRINWSKSFSPFGSWSHDSSTSLKSFDSNLNS